MNISIKDQFKKFKEQHKNLAFTKISEFFTEEEKTFYETKIAEFIAKGSDQEEAIIKARQSWVSSVGKALEDIIEILILDFCQQYNAHYTTDKKLKKQILTSELDLVKRAILIHFDEYSVLPDADFIIYQKTNENVKILAIISVKNSFRERYTETPYWKLKLNQSKITQSIKVYMISPDKDNEISITTPPRKARIVMEYELDGIYLAKPNFEPSNKVKSIQSLIDDLQNLISNNEQ